MEILRKIKRWWWRTDLHAKIVLGSDFPWRYRYLGKIMLSIPDGWHWLVKDLLYYLDRVERPWYIPQFLANILYYFGVRISHTTIFGMKEKWGTLRIETAGATDIAFILIDGYEDKSAKVCEKCGTMKDVEEEMITGWVTTLCKNCYHEITK